MTVAVWLRCVLTGHADVLLWTPTRIFMKCTDCQRETEGWDLSTPKPLVKYRRLLRFKKRLAA